MKRLGSWGSALLLVLGLSWLWHQPPSAQPLTPGIPPPARPATKAPEAAASLPALPVPVAPEQAVPEAGSPTPDPGILEKLLQLAPEDFELTHPGVLAKLAALLAEHAGDEEWEAGAVQYLAGDLGGEALIAHWEKAAALFPENLSVADALLRGVYAWSADEGRVDGILGKLSRSHPEWPAAAWLQAAGLLKKGSAEEAEALFLKTAALPVFADRAGLAERGGLKIRQALAGEGEVPPPEVFLALYGLQLPQLGRLQQSAKDVADLAGRLRAQGDPARAQALLEAAAGMGKGTSDGSRFLITHLVGVALQGKALQDLEKHAKALADVRLQEEMGKRRQALKIQQTLFQQWMREKQQTDEGKFEEIGDRVGWDAVQTEDWEQLRLRLTAEEQQLFRGLADQHLNSTEMQAYRAWLALQPKTP